jgi:hypothetical protein
MPAVRALVLAVVAVLPWLTVATVLPVLPGEGIQLYPRTGVVAHGSPVSRAVTAERPAAYVGELVVQPCSLEEFVAVQDEMAGGAVEAVGADAGVDPHVVVLVV